MYLPGRGGIAGQRGFARENAPRASRVPGDRDARVVVVAHDVRDEPAERVARDGHLHRRGHRLEPRHAAAVARVDDALVLALHLAQPALEPLDALVARVEGAAEDEEVVADVLRVGRVRAPDREDHVQVALHVVRVGAAGRGRRRAGDHHAARARVGVVGPREVLRLVLLRVADDLVVHPEPRRVELVVVGPAREEVVADPRGQAAVDHRPVADVVPREVRLVALRNLVRAAGGVHDRAEDRVHEVVDRRIRGRQRHLQVLRVLGEDGVEEHRGRHQVHRREGGLDAALVALGVHLVLVLRGGALAHREHALRDGLAPLHQALEALGREGDLVEVQPAAAEGRGLAVDLHGEGVEVLAGAELRARHARGGRRSGKPGRPGFEPPRRGAGGARAPGTTSGR